MRYREFATTLNEMGSTAALGQDIARSVKAFNSRGSEPLPAHVIGNTAIGAVANTAQNAIISQSTSTVLGVAETVLAKIIQQKIPELVESGLLKSIPGLGTIWGLYQVGKSAMAGDKTGTLLNAASMIPGGAIPAMCAQCANQMYGQVYIDANTKKPADLATDTARDPKGTWERVKKLTSMIIQEVQEGITAGMDKLSKAQAAQNQRNAVKTSSTAGNPMPGTPEFEKLQQQYAK
jgi:hypothetical protein